jgi:hypothetical protein
MLSNPSRTSATRKRSTSSSWKATPKFGRMVGKLQREPSSDASRDVIVHSDRLVGLVLSSTRGCVSRRLLVRRLVPIGKCFQGRH